MQADCKQRHKTKDKAALIHRSQKKPLEITVAVYFYCFQNESM